ncbi:hypothetical protein VT84_04160 [Gemmata sp. SH-PL17]|uniref:carboxypeptidase-like regulatory domain-containing protein n=1 Tax=Gemmata sp. SH-PL17 TaxID=1630693 RepID=UPI00078B7B7F|nr:carboxypeptidase-like regulatory domain-containing protein [Gemmata sp. SH-PL17]AMV23580.1 hypothetical protein VT84_04160 [Gemmata sp. SH-PL17]
MFSFRGFVPLFVLIVFSTGCSDPHGGRKEISGTVKFKGQSLKDGTVSFEPLDGQPTRATVLLTAGDFTIPRPTGLVPGRYLLRVSAGDGKTAVNPVEADKPPGPGGGTNIISKELIPADWNVKSKQERTVAADGPNRFEIEIP